MSKLRNVEAVKKLLIGEHKTQNRTTIGYRKKEDSEIRKVGDIWEDVSPMGHVTEWEQRDGYKVKRSKGVREILKELDSISKFPNCLDTCDGKLFGQADYKLGKKTGRCLECTIKYEADLKLNGKFDTYVHDKKKENAVSFLKEASKEVEILLKSFDNMGYSHADGSIEKWSIENKESFLEKIRSDFNNLRDDIMGTYNIKEEDLNIDVNK